MPRFLLLLAQTCFVAQVLGYEAPPSQPKTPCPLFYAKSEPPADCEPASAVSFVEDSKISHQASNGSGIDIEPLRQAFEALATMQTEYFMPDQGTWPEAIDWTAAVMETVLSGVLTSLSQAFAVIGLVPENDRELKQNLIDLYFTQLVSSYFGQDAVAIRAQAYDDILWVVLGWLDAIKFTHVQSGLHYPPRDPNSTLVPNLEDALLKTPWHGNFWVPAFAHRARIFWDTASNGWDESLCDGGMIWSPHLEPYKNAITNQLWIAASISMYLWFPGDNNAAPWVVDHSASEGRFRYSLGSTREPKYLAAAVEGYKWLMDVNMTNSAGLFVDGYHISKESKAGDKECDVRSEMVFTYNQGVLLTGQRGLFTATGSPSYLEDGHRLIQSVIRATGWDLDLGRPIDEDISSRHGSHGKLPPWRGLGRGGIMEEECDASGTCSQDGQTFKGIFFHHFLAFCEALQPPAVEEGGDFCLDYEGHKRVDEAHRSACRRYSAWVDHNARAALLTMDDKGRFGMWWGAGIFGHVRPLPTMETDDIPRNGANATDYRNYGLPNTPLWAAEKEASDVWAPNGAAKGSMATSNSALGAPTMQGQQTLAVPDDKVGSTGSRKTHAGRDSPRTTDPNDRGRGRTAETQNGGLALMRAWWEMTAGDNDIYMHTDE